MSLIEVMIALTVVSIAMLGLVSAVLACLQQTDDDREDAIAMGVARERLQTLQSYCTATKDFGNIFKFFGPSLANSSGNTDGGYSVQVSTLPNCTCNILFPVDPTNNARLLDDPGATALVPNPRAQFGTPIDLTGVNPPGSGLGIDTNDHSTDYKILPVIIRVQWDSATQYVPRVVELHAMLSAIYQ